MPITREEGTALAELLCIIRPSWNTRGVITKGLVPLVSHPAPVEVIAWAAIRAAKDPNNLTPAVIPLNGPHWNLSDRPTPPRLTPEHECPHHVGQWAATCRSCAVDAHSSPFGDPEPAPLEGNGTPRENAIARAKHAAQLAKHALHDDDDQEGDTSPSPAAATPNGSSPSSSSSAPTSPTAPPSTPPTTTPNGPDSEDSPPRSDDDKPPTTADPTHRPEQTEQGPDFCRTCSEAIGDWVAWPCPKADPIDEDRKVTTHE